jgi:hypothetical protein
MAPQHPSSEHRRLHIELHLHRRLLTDRASLALLDAPLSVGQRLAAAFRGAQLFRQLIPPRLAIDLVLARSVSSASRKISVTSSRYVRF